MGVSVNKQTLVIPGCAPEQKKMGEGGGGYWERDREGGGGMKGDRQQIDKTNRPGSQAGIRHKDGHRNTIDNRGLSGRRWRRTDGWRMTNGNIGRVRDG